MTATALAGRLDAPAQDRQRAKVAGSSFYAAMRILPKAERAAMFAIYGFCRAVDDIADDAGRPPAPSRAAALDAWRADLEALYAGGAAGARRRSWPPVRRFGLEKADFLAVIDGMQMDVDADIRAPDLADPRPLLRPGGQRRRAGCRSRCSAWTQRARASSWPIIWAGPCSSPTSCATWTRTPPSAASTCPPRSWRRPASDRATRAAVIAASAHRRRLPAAGRKARRALRPADACWPAARGRLRRPALMSAVYGAILTAMDAEGWAPPRAAGRRSARPRLLWIVLTRGLLA